MLQKELEYIENGFIYAQEYSEARIKFELDPNKENAVWLMAVIHTISERLDNEQDTALVEIKPSIGGG